MHITTHFKAVFLLVNHLVAAHVPPELIAPAHRVPGATDLKARNVWQRSTPSDPASSLSADAIHLLSRQAKSGGSCDRKARCKKKNIRNPKDESKCIRCPPLTKPDPTRTLCIKNKDVSKDDKKKQMKEKLLEKVKEKMKQFKEKRKERLEKKKAEKNKEYEKKDATRKNELNKKKNRRMAQCLPLVAAAFGTAAMLELADGGFSEDLLESIDMDLLALWPKSEEISDDWFEKSVPGDLGDINKEDFAKAYIEYGDTQVVSVVVVAGRDVEERGDNHLGLGVSTTTEVSDYQHPEDKRFVQGAIALFGLIATAIVAGAKAAASAAKAVPKGGTTGAAGASKPSTFFSNKAPSLKRPGESKFSKPQQKDKAKEVAKNKNWNQCLKGNKPQK